MKDLFKTSTTLYSFIHGTNIFTESLLWAKFCVTLTRVHSEINLENGELDKVYKNVINSVGAELLQTYNKLGRSQIHKEGIAVCHRQNEHIILGSLLVCFQNNQWRLLKRKYPVF